MGNRYARVQVKDLRRLLPYLRPYRWGIAAGLVLVVLSNALNLAVPFVVMRGVDALGVPGTTRGDLFRFAALAVAAALLGGAARYGMRELLNGISRRVEFDLRNDFFGHLLTLDASFYQRHPTGDLMSRATNDLQAVRMVAGPAYMYLVNTVVAGAFALVLMVWIDPVLTALALFPMLALPPVTIGFGRVIHRRFEKIQEQLGAVSTLVQENLSGVRIVRAYGQEDEQIRRFRASSGEYLRRNLALVRVSGLFHPLLGMIAGFAMVVALLVGGRAVMRGEITTGAFIAFLLYLGMLTWPLIALGWVVNLFQRGAASMGRINRILEEEPRIREPREPVRSDGFRGELELRGVSFRYPGTERWVLRDVSLRVPAGRTLAIVGPTGSGKSTLVALLTRLYDPTEGEVRMDGVPLTALPLARLRAEIGAVPQESFLFSETLEENLGLGIAELPTRERERRIREAARISRLDEAVESFPSGYETFLGERGINLSGGQKQRATLARAIARDPGVLVLDDALSAVDTHTEHEILDNLREVRAGRTTVIVSHRVTAVLDADRIVVLDEGRVVESGTHAELLQAGGLYAQLQHRQLLAETLSEANLLAPEAELP
jgi:ATP-binding cassette, subfamily B, multidrug efflux pump